MDYCQFWEGTCHFIVLCASQDSVREIMIKAHELEFDNGEYVFFNIDLFSSHNATLKPWYRANDTDARNAAARKAYESLMTVTLRQPTSPKYKQFSKDVKAKAAQIYPNFTYGDEEVNSFVGAFYDAVILYAHALNETIEAGGNVTDGINITRRMWNRTFDGITGKVSIDENGDRNADYSLLDMDPKTGEFQIGSEIYAYGSFNKHTSICYKNSLFT
ncbi:guanylate cyclase [Elysia marginata]|uniref:Guanylate cyclase n=1 Tax=Elysia marginata TaxID=1093978 RepID=A0AAV4FAC1_9GAST|nr:guanylate cyclase [Elysia marginata]